MGFLQSRKCIANLDLPQQGSTSLGPLQIKVSHEHCTYPETINEGTASNPESHKFCSTPTALRIQKDILFPELVFTRPNC